MKILFVCTGNTCRSPMAKVIADKIFAEAGLDIAVDSAGVNAAAGSGASQNAIKAARNNGLDLSNHISKQITDEILRGQDIVLAMTPLHAAYVREFITDDTPSVFTIREYADKTGDVSDPFGGGSDVYEKCFAELYDLITVISHKLSRMGT